MTFDALDVSTVLETSDCGAFKPIEMASQDSISSGLSRNLEVAAPITSKSIDDIISDAPSWLPFASEQYEISSDIRDYVMVPVIIIPTDLPNRNMVSFPYLELSSWNPQAGAISYQTWKGKPTHIEHINRDYTKAKGVVMDVSMQPMHGRAGNLWKVVTLCGFDRGKDAALANDILTGARTNYSMGAMVSQYSCSVCGCRAEVGSGKALPCNTKHINPRLAKFQTFDIAGEKVLGHYNAHGIHGFEVSSVSVPAWPSAVTDVKSHVRY